MAIIESMQEYRTRLNAVANIIKRHRHQTDDGQERALWGIENEDGSYTEATLKRTKSKRAGFHTWLLLITTERDDKLLGQVSIAEMVKHNADPQECMEHIRKKHPALGG